MALILLYIELGVASLIGGAALLLLLLPPNLIGGKFVEKIQRKQLIAKDHRIKVKTIFSTVSVPNEHNQVQVSITAHERNYKWN